MSLLQFFITHSVILTAVIAFGLGMWVYFDRRTDDRNITLGGLLTAVAFWSFSFVLWRAAKDLRQVEFWAKTVFFTGSLLPVLYFFFAYSFVHERLPKAQYQAMMFIPNAVLMGITYLTPWLLTMPTGAVAPAYGQGRVLFAIHFAAITIAALIAFIFAARKNDKLDRTKLASILVGTIVSFDVIFAVMFATQFGVSSNSFWVSNVALMLGMFIIASSVIQGKLLVDLKLVGIEAFILLTLFAVIADVVVSQTLVDFTLRLAILIILVFYGVIISRSLVREVRHMRELSLLTEQVTAMNGRLLEADRTKTRFVSLASHQFRAPLGGMRSYLDMLAKGDFGPVNDRQREVLDLNLGVVTQLLETIETFLDVAKIELGKLEIFKTETDLAEIINRVANHVRPLATKKNLTIETSIPSRLDPVLCDSGKIYHVLINLLDNAIKYTGAGKVTVGVERQADKVLVRVSDTGIGLDEEEKEQLFKIFKRGLAAVRLNEDGSGLGLFLVRKIIEAHGGEVFVESAGKGKGSSFSFLLPLSQPMTLGKE